jgi:hypothetical protein
MLMKMSTESKRQKAVVNDCMDEDDDEMNDNGCL